MELNYTGAIEAADPAFVREPLKEETVEWEMTDFSFESENIDDIMMEVWISLEHSPYPVKRNHRDR